MLEKLLHDMTLTWWQIGVLKACLISAGIILGIYFPNFLKKLERLRRIIFLAGAIYLIALYFG